MVSKEFLSFENFYMLLSSSKAFLSGAFNKISIATELISYFFLEKFHID